MLSDTVCTDLKIKFQALSGYRHQILQMLPLFAIASKITANREKKLENSFIPSAINGHCHFLV